MRPSLRIFAALAVALAAPFLGGATEPWAAGSAGVLVGLAMLTGARRFPPAPFLAGALLLAGAVAAGWLPRGWAAEGGWRARFEDVFGALSGGIAAQPALGLEKAIYLAVGLGFACWLLGQDWGRAERRLLVAGYGAGIAALAAVSEAAACAGFRVPFWLSERGFGPFANRNQTGSLFAVAAVVAGAMLLEEILRKRGKAWFWLPCLALTASAAVWSYSRGSVLVLFAGLALWALGRAGQMKSARWAAIFSAAVLVGVAAFFSFGGPTMRRLFEAGGAELGFRGLIYRDALGMIASGPWCGVGLGSFGDIFPQYREASAMQQRVLHPESDWLWLAAEAGWPGVLGVLLMAGAVVAGALPMREGSGRAVRWACLAGLAAFGLHAAIDVGGHRLGTALPAMLLASLALRDGRPAGAGTRRAAAAAFAAAGLAVGGAGFWLAARPDFLAAAEAAAARGAHGAAAECAGRALGRRPLDWEAAFVRGQAAAREGRFLEALGDFRRARFLEPRSVAIPFEEGLFWAKTEPRLAMQAWREALARCDEREYAERFTRMMRELPPLPGLGARMAELAEGRPALLLQYLEGLGGGEAAGVMAADLEKVSGGWSEEDRGRLRFLSARRHALEGDFARACEMLFGLLPSAPGPAGGGPGVAEALGAHLRSPGDLKAMWDLSEAQLGEGDLRGAAETLAKAAAVPGCPPHFHRRRALIHAERGEWREAWEAEEMARR
jgi:tetratricopeptide (TPR) repeat protein